ncbi:MAG: diaminopimelate epimerase [Saprospiraceae bacterium]|nr:diaminopimelate epimerase [Saprospiraceae bacterium]
MKIPFYKYQGTGNDFILIDNRNSGVEEFKQSVIAGYCQRKFGVGADGLILLQNKVGFDFEMIYYNADGNIGSMCGNGGRCIVAFANYLGLIKNKKANFLAVDGPHIAYVNSSDYVELKMIDVSVKSYDPNYIFLDTGSPHHIEFVPELDGFDVYKKGKEIRYNTIYNTKGTNVNFVEVMGSQSIKVATYERGVENETLSCGTGVTAAAIAYHLNQSMDNTVLPVNVHTKGGQLKVKFQYKNKLFSDIWLCGPALQVFKGEIDF